MNDEESREALRVLIAEARERADAEQAIFESAEIGQGPEERAADNMSLFADLADALEATVDQEGVSS